jgi:hypothetical protein
MTCVQPGQTWERADGVVGTIVQWRDGRLVFQYVPRWRQRTYYAVTPDGRPVGGVNVPPLSRPVGHDTPNPVRRARAWWRRLKRR